MKRTAARAPLAGAQHARGRTPGAVDHAAGARGRQRGFTLLEILIVVLIIGIIVTFAVLSLGNRALDDELETEAERLHQLLAIAEEDAEVQGIDLGWRYTGEGYEFLALDPAGTWAPWPGGGVLRARELPQPLYIELTIEGRAVSPSSPADKPVAPQVLLLSSGETSAFRLDLRAHGYQAFLRLQGDALGRLSKQRFEESP